MSRSMFECGEKWQCYCSVLELQRTSEVLCTVYICVRWLYTHELSDAAHPPTQQSLHLWLCSCFTPLEAPRFSSTLSWHLSYLTRWGVQSLGLSPATSLLAVIVHNTVPTSALLYALNSCHSVASNLRHFAKCMPVCAHPEDRLNISSCIKGLRYRHAFYLQRSTT